MFEMSVGCERFTPGNGLNWIFKGIHSANDLLLTNVMIQILHYAAALQNEGQHHAAAEETDPGKRPGAERQRPTHNTSVQGKPHT